MIFWPRWNSVLNLERCQCVAIRFSMGSEIVGLIAGMGQAALQDFPNGSLDFHYRAGCINFLDSLRFGSGDSLIPFCYAFEEIAIGFLDPVAHKRKCGLALKQPVGRDFVRDDEKECNVGPRVTHGNVNDGFYHLEVQLATVALIRRGGIVEAIAQNDFSSGEGWANDFADELRAAGVHEKQFCLGSHSLVLSAMFERVANFFADGSAAGLANRANGEAFKTQMFGKQRDLRGFAASFGAFEADEQPFPHSCFGLISA